MARRYWILAAVVLGCASSAVGVAAPDSGVLDGGTCAALTCWNSDRGTFALPARGTCAGDDDCVVRRFQSDQSGTIEIVGASAAGVADFDRATSTCSSRGGVPSGSPFYEGGAPATGRNAASVARCSAGCCVAVSSP